MEFDVRGKMNLLCDYVCNTSDMYIHIT